MEKRHQNEPTTTPTETTRRQLFAALMGGLLALIGLGATASHSAAKHRKKNKKSTELVPLPRPR